MTNGTYRLQAEKEGFYPSTSREGLKVYAAITYIRGMVLYHLVYYMEFYSWKVQKLFNLSLKYLTTYFSITTPYFSMIKFVFKRTLTSEDVVKIRIEIYIYFCIVEYPYIYTHICRYIQQRSGSRFSWLYLELFCYFKNIFTFFSFENVLFL